MGKIKNHNDFCEFVESQSYKLLTPYIKSNIKVSLQCPENHVFEMKPANFKFGQRCPECYKLNKRLNCRLTYEHVKSFIEDAGYKLLSETYETAHEKLLVRCPEGHEYEVQYANFYSGKRCKECFHNSQRLTYNEVKNYIESIGYKLISKKYKSIQTPIAIECENGHVIKMRLANLKFGERCPKCSSKAPFTYEHVKKIIENEGYKLLSNTYVNSTTYLDIECNKGHVYQTIFSAFQSGNRCPKCRGESLSLLFRFDANIISDKFRKRNFTPLFKSEEYKNQNTQLAYVCNIHPQIGVQHITYARFQSQKYCCKECHRESRILERSSNWKGGITNIRRYLRDSEYMKQWKKDSLKNCEYKCVVTSDKTIHIHHLFAFDLILEMVFETLQLKIKSQINDYSKDELNMITQTFQNIHDSYDLGICLNKHLHLFFHKLYGRGQNTPEQFEEFKTRLRLGEFDIFLKEHNLKLVI